MVLLAKRNEREAKTSDLAGLDRGDIGENSRVRGQMFGSKKQNGENC